MDDYVNVLIDKNLFKVLIIKNISLARFARTGSYIRDIFKTMDDAYDTEIHKTNRKRVPIIAPSSLIVLDFPSYLEKNMDTFGYYAIPVYPIIRSNGKVK